MAGEHGGAVGVGQLRDRRAAFGRRGGLHHAVVHALQIAHLAVVHALHVAGGERRRQRQK
ncbi:hypothetical protein R1A29_18505 [Pseudomonas sp. NMS19W]